jgi:mannose-6-phosphate isomerase
MELLHFTPLYMERVWGGRGFSTQLGRALPEGQVIGESWEIVDREDAQSVVAAGDYAGLSLRELLRNKATDLLGPEANGEQPFPILVKWLDCQERLSLQVHPPAGIAPQLGGEPKTENWYVAHAAPEASLIVGLKQDVTREQFEAALHNNTAEDYIHRFPVQSGDSILVESGRLHAIDGGNLILEIQQNSDTTYRVYDWGRMGLDGAPRQLHIEQSLQSIDFNDFEPEPLRSASGEQSLATCSEFRIRKFELAAGETLALPGGEEARLLHLVSGALNEVVSGMRLETSRNYLQPFVTDCQLEAESPTVLLVTDRF